MNQRNKDTTVCPDRHTTALTEDLICKGLGFCCPWLFFAVHTKTATSIIADRLGVGPRTVRIWRARFRDRELRCTNQPKCMKPKLKEIRNANKTDPSK